MVTMHRLNATLRIIAPCLLVLLILAAGCTQTEPAAAEKTGSVEVTSTPSGAEIYLDNVYSGTTPATIAAVPTGSHTLEVRMGGYERSLQRVNVTGGETTIAAVVLVKSAETMPVTVRTTTPVPRATTIVPQIHVSGYWTYPPSAGTENPVPLIVHTEAFNVGTTGAREVTVNAMLTYQGRTLCWDTVFLGTLQSGGHIATETMIPCSLPSGMKSADLTIRYQNVVVTP